MLESRAESHKSDTKNHAIHRIPGTSGNHSCRGDLPYSRDLLPDHVTTSPGALLSPGSNLIPLFNIIWHFSVVGHIARSLHNEPAKGIGLAMCILTLRTAHRTGRHGLLDYLLGKGSRVLAQARRALLPRSACAPRVVNGRRALRTNTAS
jgi:hypothetical protein